jgi:hypothetical protein
MHTDRWEGFMKYAVQMESGAMIHIPSFINTDSGIQKLIGGYTDIQSAWRSHKPIYLFKIRKVG